MEPITVSITPNVLSVDEMYAAVADPRSGGTCVFTGTTREVTDDRITVRLEYEAHNTLALNVMESLSEKARERWDLCRVAISHRTGNVPAGEISVIVAVSAPHRDAAFAACRFLIDRLKEDVPIWKRENYADGSTEWVKPLG